MKCDICGKEIEETFPSKIKGTLVKVKQNSKNKTYYACSECQKKYQGRLKEKIEKE